MGAEPLPGRVVALQANYCLVSLDGPSELGDDGRLLCTRRTRLDKSGLQVCVGDRVTVAAVDWRARRGAVVGLEPRHSLLERPAVANVNRVVVVVAVAEPGLDPLQLTRFLITAEATGQPVQVVLSKADLLPPDEVGAWCRRLEGWGYGTVAVSTRSGEGLETLRHQLAAPGIAVLCGPSGVGKSSLLNALAPALELRVAAVSGRLRRGRHTTRHVELFSVAPGALVADSPGFNTPALPDDPQILAAAFPELLARLRAIPCRFANCRHLGDPGCAMGDGWDRQLIYGRCLEEVEAAAARSRSGQGRQGERGLRQRGDRLEPLLDPQLRRSSRSTRRQGLEQDLPGLEGELSSPDREDSDPDPR
ncbi:ribosome small subunit-dependent GTPase A [Aphanothece minutissima]|uniref:Small ribosomal subunit biogenesis GTPase RsgA n=1 Tax=Aphanothece cf. minutissima CCALA 015 TaxID=2107695 RepID=A0ABX5F5K1_9CHRO|nr:ribosome small subunit-dependent GTPase A [Aphanothece minutissima]PSB36735.1 ribosome small subunit-dependent GTPase A [Aphanothece cf. minutissima CCALA 015]